jgi:hypothetical protein
MQVNTISESPYIKLDYKTNGKTINCQVQLIFDYILNGKALQVALKKNRHTHIRIGN